MRTQITIAEPVAAYETAAGTGRYAEFAFEAGDRFDLIAVARAGSARTLTRWDGGTRDVVRFVDSAVAR